MASWIDQLLVLPQYVIPQHWASKLVKRLSHIENRATKSFLIELFLKHYAVNLEEAMGSSAADYKHFNAFFTRHLKPGSRPIAYGSDTICSPADGVLSEFGRITDGSIIQAKGRTFSLADFLAEPESKPSRYRNGHFATIYLAPHNYHRVHAPVNGEVLYARYVPGDLFSVNRRTAASVGRLFARNERVLIEIQTHHHGRVMVVMVGALLVASIGLSFFDMESFVYQQNIRETVTLPLQHKPLGVEKGQELGWFNMGSTVILLFEESAYVPERSLVRGQKISMGKLLGTF